MSAVRAIADADSWSLSTGLKGYFSCCFSRSERTAAAASADGKTSAEATSEPGAPDSLAACRRSSLESRSQQDDASRDGAGSFKMVDRRLEADGASVHSTGTDKASASGTAGDQLLADDVTSSHVTPGALRGAISALIMID